MLTLCPGKSAGLRMSRKRMCVAGSRTETGNTKEILRDSACRDETKIWLWLRLQDWQEMYCHCSEEIQQVDVR